MNSGRSVRISVMNEGTVIVEFDLAKTGTPGRRHLGSKDLDILSQFELRSLGVRVVCSG